MKWFRKKQKDGTGDAASNASANSATVAPESDALSQAESAPPADQAPAASVAQANVVPETTPTPQPQPAQPLEPAPQSKPQPEAPQPPEPQPPPEVAVASEAAPAPQPVAADPGPPQQVEPKEGLFRRLKKGLRRTGSSLSDGMGQLFLGKKEIDDELLEDLESLLIMADVGMEATGDIIANLTRRVKRRELSDAAALQKALQAELTALLAPHARPLVIDTQKKPFVILMVGVNGVGKTTTIGKLAQRLQSEGRSVMLAAGDTFRAAAVEQLQVWGERHAVPVIAQHTGADSASVIFDALQAAKARQVDVLIADTAGRLHNKDNLMDELKKVVRVMGKLDEQAPHEVMLVLDAGTGQNALSQAEHFRAAVGVSGITLTKLDGTAKGGIIFAIAKNLQLPIRLIGIGEKAEDLRTFAAEEFVAALFAG